MISDQERSPAGRSPRREATATPLRVAAGAVAAGPAALPPAEPPAGAPEPDAVSRAVAAFQAGERREESFRFLFETYHRRVRGFFARRGRSAEECLDLTQETFLRVYKGLEGYRGDAPFGAWLYRIAWNVYGQLVVRRRAGEPARAGALDEELDSDAGVHDHGGASRLAVEPEGYDAVLDDERRRLLREAIGKLPEQRRKCIVLWAYHGLTYEQIASVMRLATGTVKAHLAQAREQLGRLAAGRPGSGAPETDTP
jgi:RNA polymerase sigma-70 factor (ECF subfamily)